jgi:1,2-diacylglycerol 3-alpha-glucosyltransferase
VSEYLKGARPDISPCEARLHVAPAEVSGWKCCDFARARCIKCSDLASPAWKLKGYMKLESNHRAYAAAPETPSSTGTRPHVAVLFYRIGPYHYARLKAGGSRLRVTAVEFSNVDPMYAWDLVEGADGFDRLMLFSGTAVNELPASRIFNRVGQALDQLRPQVVAIPGWHDRCSLAALTWCGSHGVPAVVMSETTAWDAERSWWKEFLKGRAVKLCAAGLVGGRAHADYLEQLGIERTKILFGYDAVDNGYFEEKAAESRKQKFEIGLKYGLPEKFFLASARFVEKKNLLRLLQAFARYRELAGNLQSGKPKAEIWDLVLLGDGPLRSSILNLRSSLGLDDHVQMPGFKQYGELPAYYGLASAFVHASTIEQWGLVVNEAMASGLTVLVSKRCGCAQDLVKDGVNGFTFDPCNIEQLASLMLKISAFDFPLSTFSSASRELISNWGPERFAQGLCAASEQALKDGAKRAVIFDRLLLRHISRQPLFYQ